MSHGQGNITFVNNPTPAAPPAPGVAGVESGLHLVANIARLGSGGVNPLLANTEVDQDGFIFSLISGADTFFFVNPAGGFSLGDGNVATNGTVLKIDSVLEEAKIESGAFGDPFLFLDIPAQQYWLGDNNFSGADTSYMEVRGGAPYPRIDLYSEETATGEFSTIGAFATGLLMRQQLGADLYEFLLSSTQSKIELNADRFLSLDFVNDIYQFGDIDSAGNGSFLSITDANRQMVYESAGADFINIDPVINRHWVGDFTLSGTNPAYMLANGSNGRLDFFVMNTASGNFANIFGNLTTGISLWSDIGGNDARFNLQPTVAAISFNDGVQGQFLRLDNIFDNYQLGDINNTSNGTRLYIDDAGEAVKILKGIGPDEFLNIDMLMGQTILQTGDIATFLNEYASIEIFAASGQPAYTQLFAQSNATDFAIFFLQSDPLNSKSYISINNGNQLLIDVTGNIYQIGDIDGINNSTHIEIDDNTQTIENLVGAGGLKITGDAAFLIHTGTSLTDYAAAANATLTNAPVAGNPTKWIAFDDNGVTRYIPTWDVPI